MPAVLCSKCAASLPDDAQFCLRCGAAVNAASPASPSSALSATLSCSKCGSLLPDGAEFCPKCGKPVSLPAKAASKPTAAGVLNQTPIDSAPIEPPGPPAGRSRIRQRVVLLALLGVFLVAFVWVTTSENPFAQGLQEMAGWKHDQSILEAPFTVSAHSFRYYKFALPEGSMRVSIVGEFTASTATRSPATNDADNGIEVYVLSEPAFAVWQNGYAATSVYESGKVPQGKLEAELPPGAGIYYLIFSNKFSSKTPKNVSASVLLRYKNWLPESIRHAKDRFWNWLGL